MKFVIFGAGGVGAFFGAKLASRGNEVWFVARGEHLAVMRRNGLRVRASEGLFAIPPGRMTGDTNEIGPADVILFCVKSYDTETAARQLAPLLTQNSIIVSLQNGIDNEQIIQRVVSTGWVYGGVAYIYSTITAPGEITQSGGPRKIVFGPLQQLDKSEEVRAQSIVATMVGSGIDAEWTKDIQPVLWKKFIFISPVSGLTALTRLTLREILAVPETRQLLADAMEEAYALARASGVGLESDFVRTTLKSLEGYPNDTRSSLYNDLIRQRPLELDALAGTVVRLGKSMNIPTPIHRTIYASLLPYAVQYAAPNLARHQL